MIVTGSQLIRTLSEWRRISTDETGVIRQIKGSLYFFTDEFGALKLFYHFNQVTRNENTCIGLNHDSDIKASRFFCLDLDA